MWLCGRLLSHPCLANTSRGFGGNQPHPKGRKGIRRGFRVPEEYSRRILYFVSKMLLQLLSYTVLDCNASPMSVWPMAGCEFEGPWASQSTNQSALVRSATCPHREILTEISPGTIDDQPHEAQILRLSHFRIYQFQLFPSLGFMSIPRGLGPRDE